MIKSLRNAIMLLSTYKRGLSTYYLVG